MTVVGDESVLVHQPGTPLGTMLKRFRTKRKNKDKEESEDGVERGKEYEKVNETDNGGVPLINNSTKSSIRPTDKINPERSNDHVVDNRVKNSIINTNSENNDTSSKVSRRSSIIAPFSKSTSNTTLGVIKNINNSSSSIPNDNNCNNNSNSNSHVNSNNLKKHNSYTNNHLNKTSTGIPQNSKLLKTNKRIFTPDQIHHYQYTITNPSNLQLPFGDGADKLFGIENYGYICYVNSIFQCLYHIKEFRESIMSFPERDTRTKRKRKFIIDGKSLTQFEKTLDSQNQQLKQQIQQIKQSNQSNNKKSFFGKSHNSENTDTNNEKNNANNSNGNTNESSNGNNNTISLDDIPYTQASFALADKSCQDNQLEKHLKMIYPAFNKLEINYFLNGQRNLTLVGILNDPNASSDWRKKAAMIQGPIINLDESKNLDYQLEEDSLFTVLKDCFECITENYSTTGVLSPFNLIEIIKRENILFRNFQHQDAHEFLNFLINNIIDCLKKFSKEDIITDIFEGELTSETKCLTCDTLSYRDEKFLDLSIDLEPDSSISNCLKIFSKIEMLNEDNKFYCENCYSYQEAAKSIKLKKVPKILTFHLKRFKYSEKLGRLVKLFYRVEYVKNLRIYNTTKNSNEKDKFYELYGVVVHIGSGPYHGHYVSLVKTELYGWLLFDDETIEKIDEDYVFKFFGDGSGLSTAYLLFYKEIVDDKQYYKEQLFNGLEDDSDEEEMFSKCGTNEDNNEYECGETTIISSIAEDLTSNEINERENGRINRNKRGGVKYTVEDNEHLKAGFDPFHEAGASKDNVSVIGGFLRKQKEAN